MTPKRWNTWMVIWISVLAITILSCQALSRATPTSIPRPTRTLKPTAVPVVEEPIPAPTEEAVPDPEPTQVEGLAIPKSGEVKILQVNAYEDAGSWTVFGLLENTSEKALNNLVIEVQGLDEGGKVIYTNTTYSSLYTLDPGEKSPFSFFLYEEIAGIKNFTATVTDYRSEAERSPQIEIGSVSLTEDENGYIYLAGEIFNKEEDPIVIYPVVVASFDESGNIISVDSAYDLLSAVDPGEKSSFRATIYSLSGTDRAKMDTYEFYLDADFYDPVTYDVTFGTITDYVDDTYGSFHLVGEVTNNSDQSLYVKLVGVILDAQGQVIDVSTTDLVYNNFDPGETLPFSFSYWGPLNTIADFYTRASDYVITVDWYASGTSYYESIPLSTSEVTIKEDEYMGFEFEGKVSNDSGIDVDSITVGVAIYDKDTGNVLGTGYTFLYESLPNGSSLEFNIILPVQEEWELSNIDYKVLAKAIKP